MAYGGNRGGGFRRNSNSSFRRFGPREMHKITCSECGKEAEVPFKPREGTPVYCRDCFFKKKGITPREEKKEETEETKEEAKEETTEETEDETEEEETED
jgi:CxxC-x17-CxxC domain-containing protein